VRVEPLLLSYGFLKKKKTKKYINGIKQYRQKLQDYPDVDFVLVFLCSVIIARGEYGDNAIQTEKN